MDCFLKTFAVRYVVELLELLELFELLEPLELLGLLDLLELLGALWNVVRAAVLRSMGYGP